MPGNFQGIVFDLDGTLLNTLDDLAYAMNMALEKKGFPIHPVDAYRQFVGDGVSMLTRRASGILEGHEKKITAISTMFMEQYKQCGTERTIPYEGIDELLKHLASRQMSLAVLSNKPHESTVDMVRHYFPAYQFVAIIGDGIFARKPDPEAACYIASVMGCTPQSCLYIGDTGTDMTTARAASMRPAGALWGFRDERELRASGAEWVVHNPDEILDIIG